MMIPSIKDLNLKVPAEHVFLLQPGFRFYVQSLLSRYPIATLPQPGNDSEWGDLYDILSQAMHKDIENHIRACRLIPDIRPPSAEDLVSQTQYSSTIHVRVTLIRPVLLKTDIVDTVARANPADATILRLAIGTIISTCPVSTPEQWGEEILMHPLTEQMLQQCKDDLSRRYETLESPKTTLEALKTALNARKNLLGSTRTRWCSQVIDTAETFATYGQPLKAYTGRRSIPSAPEEDEEQSSRDITHFYIIGNDDPICEEFLRFVELTVRDLEYKGVFYMNINTISDTEQLFAICHALRNLEDIIDTAQQTWGPS